MPALRHCCVIIPLLFIFNLHVQTSKISGRVFSSENDTPLPGVSVSIKEANGGITTNQSGDFSISVEPGSILVFSYIGFNSKEITIKGNAAGINIRLTPNPGSPQFRGGDRLVQNSGW